ncbi:Leucine rich repeat [Popillia japonica]|uniref:Leucine rich repeat n=1 Tax=Popillia japonica TaxID=7064 RepID=A0AAW1MDW7_POPJA
MDASMEVLRVTAPENHLNALTMNPMIQSYKRLEEIHITRSNIPNLGMHFFWGLDKLEVLNLSQNNITQPLDHNFRGLQGLKELYLDDQFKIYSLPSGTFRYLVNLATLSIQRNSMHEMMPRVFQQLERLQVLKLSGNSLVKLNPEIFKDLRVCEIFYLYFTISGIEIYMKLGNI